MLENPPKPNKKEDFSHYWEKIPRKIATVLGITAIIMSQSNDSFAQSQNKDTKNNYYSETDFKYQKEQILSYKTSNSLIYTSVTQKIQKHLESLKTKSQKEYRLFQKELEKGKEYSIITNQNTLLFEIIHILVGKEGKVLGTMIQQNKGKTMHSFIDINGDGMIDRVIIDDNPISNIREKIQFAHQCISPGLEVIAEQFTNKEREAYFPHNLVITDFSLSDSQSEITSVNYNNPDRPLGIKKTGSETFIKILEESERMHAGLIHAQNHIRNLTEENFITGPLVSK